jgi:hypothetical protein
MDNGKWKSADRNRKNGRKLIIWCRNPWPKFLGVAKPCGPLAPTPLPNPMISLHICLYISEATDYGKMYYKPYSYYPLEW